MTTLQSIKAELRISHDQMDDLLNEEIDECLEDLGLVGVAIDNLDTNILRAVKLYCHVNHAEDVYRSEVYKRLYDAHKSTLMVSEGYGYDG